MGLFDIIGPIMVGPSSSHTAGAVRIGYMTRTLLGQEVKDAVIGLYGSFLLTGRGHGTGKALVAGLLGMREDDERIPNSFQIAKERGITFRFEEAVLKEAHPNSVSITVTGTEGKVRTVGACSIGGGLIKITKIDDIDTSFTGEYPTLIARNQDKPGMILKVAEILDEIDINVASLNVYKDKRKKGSAIMIVECDEAIPYAIVDEIREFEGIGRVIYIAKEGLRPTPHIMEKTDQYFKNCKQTFGEQEQACKERAHHRIQTERAMKESMVNA
ncbi:MAG: L-serine ammonia-lyase, iron-sulfur-dependent, subunit beta [Blautia sp.]|nr:L-serine ammonia-lyase, iron-sulfur-dependent, subunit beta [Blautia sp.]